MRKREDKYSLIYMLQDTHVPMAGKDPEQVAYLSNLSSSD